MPKQGLLKLSYRAAFAFSTRAAKATESWIISDKNVEDYFLDVYGSEENFKAIFGYDMPKTLKTVHPEIHYRIFGQNEMGMDAARNTLKFLNYLNLQFEPYVLQLRVNVF